MKTRIYHPYWMWEDYKNGFYDNCSGEQKKEMILLVVEFFSNPKLTREYMTLVINNWVNSCQHNLTNESMNKIAYLGQAACCLWKGIPNTVTMEAWSLVSNEYQNIANKIAEEVLNHWIYQNKFIQLCLNFH